MPTENRSSNNEMVSVPPFIGMEPLVGRYYPAMCRRCGWVGSSEELTEDDAQCTRDIGDRLCLGDCDELERHDLLNIIQAMAQPAEQHQDEYPPCDYCGTVPTYHPWHGSGMLNGVENRHIHACDGCRGKLPVHPGQYQGEPVWFMTEGSVSAIHAKTKAISDQQGLDTSSYSVPLYTHADPGEVERLRAALKFYAEREHYHFESGNWDTVSGEPLNILWCGDEPDFIEDGSVARAALSASAEPKS